MRGRFTLSAFVVACALLVPVAPAFAGKPRKSPPPDTTPPSVAVSTPAPGATLAGTVTVAGTAADNAQLAKVEVSVDGGVYALASGTTSWSAYLDTTAYGDGSHVLSARATDAAGNASVASVSVMVSNAPAPPPPPADTTPPSVAISAPASGATVAGTVSVAGTSSDDASVAKIELSVDGGAYAPAQGTASWTASVDTTTLADGSHTLTARAVDTSGNASATSEAVTVKNSATPPPGVAQQMVTPEGATIQIYSDVAGWTAQQIYDLLAPNALELARIGPSLTIKVQTTTASSTATSASQTGGVYGSYKATLYLQAKAGTTFASRPDAIVAHEYGHVWTLYHLYLSHNGDWSPYLVERGIANDPRLGTSYSWSKNEMIADDYRMLFGTPAAVSELAYLNPDVPDPRDVPGLHDWFLSTWATP
jgi:Bacterial Ig domain